MKPRFVLTTAIAAASFAALLPAGPASAAKHDKAVLVSHTYQVNYELSGRYLSTTKYEDGNAEGFCPGSGSSEDTTFDLKVGGKIKVDLDGDLQVRSKQVLPGTDIGDWSIEGTSYASNDCSGAAIPEQCSGPIALSDAGKGNNNLSVTGKGKKLAFEFLLQGPPQEVSQPSDCDQNTDRAPGPAFGLFGALAPYDDVSLKLPLAKLAAARTFSGAAKPVQVNPGYDVTTCDDSDVCRAELAHLKSQITVKQVG